MTSDLKINYMSDGEISELIETCSAMFGTYKLTTPALTAFAYILKSKFPLMRGEQILKLCTDTAASPPKYDFRFTPAFLALILKSRDRPDYELNSTEREATMEEKVKYRQEFLRDLYADFDDFKHGQKPHRIKVWQYVAELFVRKGFAERLPDVREETGTRVGDILDLYRPFVQNCFDKLIKNNQHVSTVIYGLEN